jgi:hypothetical protein
MPGLQTIKTTLVVWPQSASTNGWQAPPQAALRAASAQPAGRGAAAQERPKPLISRRFLQMSVAALQNNK